MRLTSNSSLLLLLPLPVAARDNNCPQCRAEFSSRRDCKPDKSFDALLRLLFGDLAAFEERVLDPSRETVAAAHAVGAALRDQVCAGRQGRGRGGWGPGGGWPGGRELGRMDWAVVGLGTCRRNGRVGVAGRLGAGWTSGSR